jgi:hypothetical protein
MKEFISVICFTVILLASQVLLAGCRQESKYPYRISIEEANEIVGAPLPVPNYLPEGYKIIGIFLTERNESLVTIVIFISNKDIEEAKKTDINEMPQDITMKVTLYRNGAIGGLKIVGYWYHLGKTNGVLETKEENNVLWWILPYPVLPGQYKIALSAIKDIPREEMIKIAKSVDQ